MLEKKHISMRRKVLGLGFQLGFLLAVAPLVLVATFKGAAQDPVVVQPGAPGQPTKTLPAATRAVLPPTSPKDIEFMQGMIMHHSAGGRDDRAHPDAFDQ